MLRAAKLRSALPAAASRRAPALCAPFSRRFHALGVSDALVEKLRAMGITTPSAAQQKAIPLVLRGDRDVVIAAETGGGKTLAYLVPVLDRLRRHALPLDAIHKPVALVLTTSQELVAQVERVVRALDGDAARCTTALSSSHQQLPRRACPLLVATPKALLRATTPRDFAFTQWIVVDEADMLLGGGFERDTKQILATIRNQPLKKAELNQWTASGHSDDDDAVAAGRDLSPDEIAHDKRQTIFTYATIPDYGKRSVHEFIQYKFPDAQFAVTDDFHRTLPRVDVAVHHLEDFAPDATPDATTARLELLAQILADAATSDGGHTLVFANSIESADALHAYLTTTQKMDALLFHKEIARDARREILDRLNERGASVVVVCTDIAARGLDTTNVRHVVQYEFASDVVSYIHRIGRTARAGTSGKVSSIVSAQNALVLSKIQEAGGDSLHGAFSRKRSLRKKVKKIRREARDADC